MCVCAAALVKSWSSTRQSHASRVIFTATSGSLNQPLFQLGQHMTLEATLRFGKSGEEKKLCFLYTHGCLGQLVLHTWPATSRTQRVPPE